MYTLRSWASSTISTLYFCSRKSWGSRAGQVTPQPLLMEPQTPNTDCAPGLGKPGFVTSVRYFSLASVSSSVERGQQDPSPGDMGRR